MKTDKITADFWNKPPFRADHVGSFLRPESIKKARKQLLDKEITPDDLRMVENEAIRHLVEKQKQCGLKAVTDGEFRRSWWHLDFFAGLEGIQKAVDSVFDQVMQAQMGSSAGSSEMAAYMNSAEGKKMMEQMKQEALKQFQPVIDAVDGQWIKISSSDLAGVSSKEATCMFDALKMMQTDTDARKELAKAYQNNAFLVIKGEAEGKDGLKGYDIEIDKTKTKEFASAAGDTKVGRKLKDCGGASMTESMTDSSKYGSVERFRVWISGSEIRSIELVQKADGAEMKTTYDVQAGKTESIDVPSDAKSITDLQEELSEAMGGASGEPSLLDSFAI